MQKQQEKMHKIQDHESKTTYLLRVSGAQSAVTKWSGL